MSEYAVESSAKTVFDLNEKIRVLHVDDDSGFLKIARQCLEMEGPLQVETALSVEEALAKLEKEKYDIVVSDYQMPGKDGLKFLKELREKGNTIPFIIFTGKGREEVAIKALNLGANQYLNKMGETETVYTELAHGITELAKIRRAEDAIKQSEQKYRELFENATDVIVTLDLKGNATTVNNAILRFGYRKEEVVGKNILKFVSKKHWPIVAEDLSQTAQGKPVRNEVEIEIPEGTRIAEYRTNPLMREGRVIGAQIVLRDVTERKKAELELFDRQMRLQNILAASPDAITLVDLKGAIVECNQASADLYGYSSKEELIGKNALDFIAKKDYQRAMENMKKTIEQGQTRNLAYALVSRQGHETQVEVAANTVRDASGIPVGFVAVVREITERKRVEEVLKESEEKFRGIFENAGDSIVFLDTSGRILDINRKAAETFGGSKEELLGKHFTKIGALSPRDIPKLLSLYAKALVGQNVRLNLRIRNKKGEQKLLECYGSTIKTGNKVVATMVIARDRDITEGKRFEEVWRRSEEQARSLLEFQEKIIESPLVWINLLDRGGNITLWNRGAELISGYSREEAIGHKKIWGWLYPDSQYCSWNLARARKLIETKGCVEKDDTTIRCKDGKLKTITWNSNSISDEDENPSGSLAVGIDITERKTAESKLAMMNEKLRVVGDLTRHDVKNKLSAIVGNAYLARKELPSGGKALNHLKEIETSVGHIVRIFDFARNYEMLGVEDLAYIDVGKRFDEAISLFPDLKEIKVTNDCNDLTVFADSLLRQLFYNLIDNSLKYGQKISKIRLYYEEKGHSGLKLIYEDDGIGIRAADKPKLFKEGYSTGESTGYGLYLIKKMTEAYGWTIQETGEPGKEAQFTITIPKINQTGKENYLLARER